MLESGGATARPRGPRDPYGLGLRRLQLADERAAFNFATAELSRVNSSRVCQRSGARAPVGEMGMRYLRVNCLAFEEIWSAWAVRCNRAGLST